MSRADAHPPARPSRFPRSRGDEPGWLANLKGADGFSPLTRG
ncbi:hypothetical protein HMPREF1978_01871 [Actinomyces graevenitzii F0530]|uniref:Uncharacterized protein n=1 Tax=Actinomyces graevenitzii F0530 TaxID=1321817 RepID=U1PUS6_9ACTO|nr:hypothetical protein HMPREF1978_01871 [Actinomyces graevenitzii F0530]